MVGIDFFKLKVIALLCQCEKSLWITLIRHWVFAFLLYYYSLVFFLTEVEKLCRCLQWCCVCGLKILCLVILFDHYLLGLLLPSLSQFQALFEIGDNIEHLLSNWRPIFKALKKVLEKNFGHKTWKRFILSNTY